MAFALEAHSRCNYDSVELRNGLSSSSTLIGKYCGTIIPQNVIRDGQGIYIKFKTDGSGARNGFKARFMAVAGPTTESSGKIINMKDLVSAGHQKNTGTIPFQFLVLIKWKI